MPKPTTKPAFPKATNARPSGERIARSRTPCWQHREQQQNDREVSRPAAHENSQSNPTRTACHPKQAPARREPTLQLRQRPAERPICRIAGEAVAGHRLDRAAACAPGLVLRDHAVRDAQNARRRVGKGEPSCGFRRTVFGAIDASTGHETGDTRDNAPEAHGASRCAMPAMMDIVRLGVIDRTNNMYSNHLNS